MTKAYKIEILFKTSDVYYNLGRTFKTQKAAREWCERQGLVPIFGGKRPSLFWGERNRWGEHGMQAAIREVGRCGWIDSSTEGGIARKIARASF